MPQIVVFIAFLFLAYGAYSWWQRRGRRVVRPDGTIVHVYHIRARARYDHFLRDGIDEVARYVDRLFASKTRFTTVSFFGVTSDRGVSLWKEQDGLSFRFTFRAQADRESKARLFFEKRGFGTTQDYLAGDQVTRIVGWRVEGDVNEISELCRTVFRDLCDLSDSDGLKISYDPHKRWGWLPF